MSHWFDQLAKRAAGATPAQPPTQVGARAPTPEVTTATPPAQGEHGYTRRRGLQLAMFALLGTTVGSHTLLWPSPARADEAACGDALNTCRLHVEINRLNQVQACIESNLRTGDIYDIIAMNDCIVMAEYFDYGIGLNACVRQYDNCYEAAGVGTPPPLPPPDTGCGPGTEDCAACCGYAVECECVCLGGVWCGNFCAFSGYCPH